MAVLALAINWVSGAFVSRAAAESFAPSFAPAPTVILAFGDSLTAGYGVLASESFPARLEALLRQEGHDVRVVNAGVSGDTTAGGVARLEWVLQQNPPDVAILELGANDMLRMLDAEQMRQNLQKMIDIFKQRNIPVLLAGMKSFRNLGDLRAQAYESVFSDLAEKNDLLFYPFFLKGVALEPSLNLEDGLHPNAAGINIIAEKMLPLVEKLIKQDTKQK